MRIGLLVAGVVLLLLGGVWILQGAGMLKGSFMTGQSRWLWIGIGCAVVGVGLLLTGLRTSAR
jgi:hypothetical protein